MFKKVIKNSSVISLGTLVSRIFGFIRDILIAKFFGTSDVLEAFLVAFRLPNLFRSVFAEGFTEAVATPVLSEYHKYRDKLFEIGNHLLSLLIVILSLFTLLGIIFSKYLLILIAPGFTSNLYKFNLAVSFTRLTFIYLLLIGVSSNIVSILYSLKKFFVSAINPVFLNISFIAGILFFSRFFKNYILVICVLVAGVLEVIFPFVSLKREGFSLKFNFKDSLKDNVIIKMLKLFLPRVWSSIIYHLNVFVDTIFSSFANIVGQGAVASVYYANRLIQLPFALIALSIAPVVIVDLSLYYKEGDLERFKKLFVFSFQNIVFFILPISSIFLFIPQGIIEVLFKRGEFGLSALNITASCLFFYSFGLFFFCAIKLLVISFYSLKDTFTPAKTSTLSLILNVIFSAIFMFPLKIGGVALGTSLSSIFNYFFLYRHLIKKIGKLDWQDTKWQFLKVTLLSLIIGVISHFLWTALSYHKYFKLLIILSISLMIYILGGMILKINQINYMKRWILNRNFSNEKFRCSENEK